MAAPLHFVACAAALLAGGASAGRIRDVTLVEALHSEKFLGAPDSLICGSTRIRELIAGPKGEMLVRNIEWNEAFNVADGYIESQSSEIAKLEDEVKRLQQQILEKLQQEAEARLTLSAEQIAAPVVAAVESGYGSFALAKDTKCLLERTKGSPRSSVALRAAVDAFSASIKELLTSSKGSLSSGDVRNECERQLQVGGSNCEELCQQMGDAAQRASDALGGARAPTGRSSDQLRRELEAKEAALRFAIAERDACAQTKADIGIFKEQIGALKVDITDKHDRFLEANDALYDVRDSLENAGKNLMEQENSANAAAEVLAGAGVKAQAAQVKFRTANTKAMEVTTVMSAAKTQLVASEQQLKKTQDANGILEQLKAAVSETMLRLVLYFDDAVRRPVRKLGLGEKTNVDRFFPEDVGAIVSAVDAKSSIQSLASFCSSSATQSALNAVSKPGVDMSVLCVIGDVPDINMDIDLAVAQRVEHLKESLRKVQSWLDPYKGQSGVDEVFVEDSVKKGEPVGLREVISTFGQTTYYKNYLKQWKLKGEFLRLYAALGAALEEAQDKHKEADDQLNAVALQLQSAVEAQTEAKEALASALEFNEVAEGQHQQAQQLLQQASATAENLAKDLKALQEAVHEAHRRYEAAIAALLKTHQEHTSLVELLQTLEEE